MKEVVLELQTKRASNGLSKPTKPQKTMRDDSGGQTFFGLPTHPTLATLANLATNPMLAIVPIPLLAILSRKTNFTSPRIITF